MLVSTLVWLVLGYAFYCWVYAAAGSLAERQDQVQTLAFPLSVPIIFGYIMALTASELGEPVQLLQGARLPASDGTVRHARSRRAESGHLVGVRRFGGDQRGVHHRSGAGGEQHLPPGHSPHRKTRQTP